MVKEFKKYLVAAIITFVFDMLTLLLLNKIGFRPYVCLIINQIFVAYFDFAVNKIWTFKSNNKLSKQIIKYILLVVFNYFATVFVMYLFNERLGFDFIIVRLTTIAVMSIWTFFAYKFWVYKYISSVN